MLGDARMIMDRIYGAPSLEGHVAEKLLRKQREAERERSHTPASADPRDPSEARRDG